MSRSWAFRQRGDLLPALVVMTLPFGPLLSNVNGGSLIFTTSQGLTVVLLLRVVLGPEGKTRGPGPWVLWAVLLLGLPLFYVINVQSASVAYFNFAVGVLGGTVVGRYWAASPRDQINLIDVGILLVPCIAAVQLILSVSPADSVAALHQYSDVGWGRSNYVAAVIVISSLAGIARLLEASAPRPVLLVPVCTCLISLLAVSRGGILVLGAGACVLLWAWPRPSGLLVWSRVWAISLLALAAFAVDVARDFRAESSTQVDLNVDSRFRLSNLAFRIFTENPLGGTGWTALREPSLFELGRQQSFAHNVIPSFLQIGGLLSMPFLMLLAYRTVCAIRVGGVLLAPVVACVVFSMTDPFFEGTIGGVLAWACLTVVQARMSNSRSEARLQQGRFVMPRGPSGADGRGRSKSVQQGAATRLIRR